MAATTPAGPAPADHPAPDPGVAPGDGPRAPGAVTFAGLGALVALLTGLVSGWSPLRDNSFFTHLATGRLILDTGTVPSADPYSFTAAGEPWVVQSWLASWAYAVVERLGGVHLLHAAMAATTAGLALLVWRLTRPAPTLLGRALLATPALAAGFLAWSERPLLLGLVGLCLVLLVVQGELRPGWLAPAFAVWVNVHGSFAMGLALLALVGAGRLLDERAWPRREVTALAAGAAGAVVGALVSPVGIDLLTFPVELLGNEEVRTIEEWRAPSPTAPATWVLVVTLVVVAAFVARRARRWALVLPLVAFAASALTSARQIAPTLVLVAGLLAPHLPAVGSLDPGHAPAAGRRVAAGLLALALLWSGVALARPAVDLRAYPVAELDRLEAAGLVPGDLRIVSHDVVGNYLELRYGPAQPVFIDDRLDMYPADVPRDYRLLMDGGEGWREVLDRRAAQLVIWQSDRELVDHLRGDPAWEVLDGVDDADRADGTETYVVLCRRGASPAC